MDLDRTIELATAEYQASRPEVMQIYDYVCKNPRPPVDLAMECAVVVDEPLAPILDSFLRGFGPHYRSVSLQPRTLAPATRLFRYAPPALLVLHSNWCISAGAEVLAIFAALSPATRYMILTGWAPPYDMFRDVATALRISVTILGAPCRVQAFRDAVQQASRLDVPFRDLTKPK
jgi:hypothetical protein